MAGPRAPNPLVHNFSVPSMVLGSRPTVYFQSRHSEHSAPPRAQIVKKGTQGKQMSQLAGSTGPQRCTLLSTDPTPLRGGPEWWTIGKTKPASLFMLAPPCTSILCLFSLVPLTPDWTLTIVLFHSRYTSDEMLERCGYGEVRGLALSLGPLEERRAHGVPRPLNHRD